MSRGGYPSLGSHRSLPGGGNLGIGPQILIGKHKGRMGALGHGTRECRGSWATGEAAGS